MNPVERLLGAVINPVVDAVDVDGMVSKVDVDRLVSEVDLDALLQRVDLDELLARIDVDQLLARIDVDSLLDRIDVDALMERIDMAKLTARLDVQSVVDRIDVDSVIAKVDVAALAKRAGIDDIVSEATRGVTSRILAMVRRQIVGLDLIANGIWARLTRRPRPEPPSGDTATGAVAGPVSRLLAYFVDIAAITFGFSVLTSIVTYLVDLFFGEQLDSSDHSWGWVFGLGYLVFGFLYWLIGLTIAGSSVGKALVGLRVLDLDERPLKGRQALVRVIVYPFSFILGLGLMPIVTARSHRALHDKVAGTTVRYDWGDGDEESRSPLTRWMRGKKVTTGWVAPAPAAEPTSEPTAAAETEPTPDTTTATATATSPSAEPTMAAASPPAPAAPARLPQRFALSQRPAPAESSEPSTAPEPTTSDTASSATEPPAASSPHVEIATTETTGTPKPAAPTTPTAPPTAAPEPTTAAGSVDRSSTNGSTNGSGPGAPPAT